IVDLAQACERAVDQNIQPDIRVAALGLALKLAQHLRFARRAGRYPSRHRVGEMESDQRAHIIGDLVANIPRHIGAQRLERGYWRSSPYDGRVPRISSRRRAVADASSERSGRITTPYSLRAASRETSSATTSARTACASRSSGSPQPPPPPV